MSYQLYNLSESDIYRHYNRLSVITSRPSHVYVLGGIVWEYIPY